MRTTGVIACFCMVFLAACDPVSPPMDHSATPSDAEWQPLFNGENLDGWTVRGDSEWKVVDGVIVGESQGRHGHIYAAPELTDLEVRGMFRIRSTGGSANSGLYFRANPPGGDPEGYPRGYEAQICHDHDAPTGWLWKPGSPTGEASAVTSKDGEWFSMRVMAVGNQIDIYVNGDHVMSHQDNEYKTGYFAIQCHNAGMIIEAKDLEYRDLSQ